MSDTILFFLFFGAIGGLVLVSETLERLHLISRELNRKAVHIGVGTLVLIAIQSFHSLIPLIILSGIFCVVNPLSQILGITRGIHGVERETLGTFFFPLAVLINTLIFGQNRTLLTYSLLPMFYGDALATIVGKRMPLLKFNSLTKSLGGFLTLLIFTFSVISIGFRGYSLFIIFLISVAVAVAELSATGGFDNFAIPAVTGLLLTALVNRVSISEFLSATVFALLISYLSYRTRALTMDGTLMMGVMGFLILLLGGMKFLIPIIVFFVTSSALTKWLKGKSNVKPGESRDSFQVLANGGLALILSCIHYLKITNLDLYPIYLGVLAVVNSDTWSTEIGSLSRTDPRSIILFKKVPKGTSGAVSMIGTIGGILGSLAIAIIAFGFGYSWGTVLMVILVGSVGNLVDSILGATIEVRYLCQDCGGIFDVDFHCNTKAIFNGGIRWFNNNWVNFSASLAGGILALVFLLLYT